MFEKVLVANRGEIAVRVIRSLREMGIASVAVFSEADREALHVRLADEAYCVGPASSNESYLRIDKILEVVEKSGAQAIHPGYGFLSENADFARACDEAGVVFIGPKPYAIEAMGEKTRARTLMEKAGVPLVPGTEDAIEDAEEALEIAKEMGFPVLVKASAGGGGKGMRRVDRAEDFIASFEGARREALSAFGNGDVFVEKYVVNPKHVEIQVLADGHGNCVHLFERDCSVQRRHQKIIEETPCPVLEEATRKAMGEVAVKAAQAVDYIGAGTVEFLLDHEQNFYFLEMNTRLQVEHPITEMITGMDLVRWQVRIADGEELPFTQEDLKSSGHAIECRIYAEDPENNFMPAPGPISYLSGPDGPGVREDSGVYSGATVPVHYDPMISKLVVWGEDREHALGRMRRALSEYTVSGIITNIAFHQEVLGHPDFVEGAYDTEFVPRMMKDRQKPAPAHTEVAELAAVLAAHRRDEAIAEAGGGAEGAKATQKAGSGWKQLGRFRALRRY
ncbi:acetyl-CoA carboxylase biotin carboxylase subunit [Persicimonas caeni]|uniref:Acetyl-CoA carboxylase biotin carboxylase subunit n=1 Tax=Persicimonas caeni TaxID=2292766 RepID=A0A4Y6PQR9_PERCE|nr:acetyl-CoA carboxylase biotin carboxylase subunit [Persicimonas caeni]QDG50666.1 acetyl-CoA carboxylase biotin carboxylase subunit [Persicimonas caeni]QED31887.1 acetyl-CoA carboxylase biotin carboxylase subunit [Persicimonas caeni]